MKTVIETPTFTYQAGKIWTEENKDEFIDFISSNPTAGDLITNSGGARKVRWKSKKGAGKSGGVRVITITETEDAVTLIAIYRKSQVTTIKGHEIKEMNK